MICHQNYHIFRYGCILSTPFCLAFSQISSVTRKLALKYLYSTIITGIQSFVTTEIVWQKVVARPTDSIIPGFFPRSHVRSVWNKYMDEKFLDIFRSCDHLSRVALRELDFRFMVHLSSI